tara:strand:+ start:2076 stop:2495 length:420 start_codon:yes stop_codon:yes gene_type:complete
MEIERTLSIIKPDATSRNIIGQIITRFEDNGLKIIAAKLIYLNKDQAESFYAEHKDKAFFKNLVQYMTSAPVLIQVLEGKNAIEKNRALMGSTNPSDAAPGTIRADFAQSIDANAVHGSDSTKSADREIKFFFDKKEIF